MDGYNGYKNYETWAVNLWLTNEEPIYRYLLELKNYAEDVYELANMIEEYMEEYEPELKGAYSDLLSHALGQVDYIEIANNFWED